MREILFRGKRIDNGEWVYGWYAEIGGKSYIYTGEDKTKYTEYELETGMALYDYYIQNPKRYEVDPNTVSQYTGLKDKNGTKIFEGDILKTNTDSVITPKWINNFKGHEVAQFIFSIQGIKDGWIHPVNGIGSEWEVIGNIWEETK